MSKCCLQNISTTMFFQQFFPSQMSTSSGSSQKPLSHSWFLSLSHRLYPIPQKIPLALPSKYIIDLTSSHCFYCCLPLFHWITLSGFFRGFPDTTFAPYSPQYKRQSDSVSVYPLPKTFRWLPVLLKSKVLTKACKAFTIWPSITSLNSSFIIFLLIHSAPAARASLLVRARHAPTLGLLHWLFPLPCILFQPKYLHR